MQDLHDENLILAYVEGDMPDPQRHEFKLAMMKDARLRRLVEQLQADRDGLRSLPAEAAPAQLMEHVQQHFEREMLLGPQTRAAQPSRYTFNRIAAFAAMAAMIMLGAGLIYQTFLTEPGSAARRPEVAMQSAPAVQELNDDEAADPAPAARAFSNVAKEQMQRKAPALKKSMAIAEADGDEAGVEVKARGQVKDRREREEKNELDMALPLRIAEARPSPAPAEAMKMAVLPPAPTEPGMAAMMESAVEPRDDRPKPFSIGETAGLAAGAMMDASAALPAPPSPAAAAAPTVADAPAGQPVTRARRRGVRSWAPSSIALAVTTGHPDAALKRLIDWAEVHEVTVRFTARRSDDSTANTPLPDLGKEQRRIQLRMKAGQLHELMSHMQDGSYGSQLVRLPRRRPGGVGRPGRQDISDFIAQEVPIEPSSLRLRDRQTLRLDVILRLPPVLGDVTNR